MARPVRLFCHGSPPAETREFDRIHLTGFVAEWGREVEGSGRAWARAVGPPGAACRSRDTSTPASWRSRRFPVVVRQKAAEFLLALDRARSKRNRRGLCLHGRQQCTIIPSLVRAMLIVKGLKAFHDVPQMINAEAHEMVEHLVADRLHKPLRERIQFGFRGPTRTISIPSLSNMPRNRAVNFASMSMITCVGSTGSSAKIIAMFRACCTTHASSGAVVIPAT